MAQKKIAGLVKRGDVWYVNKRLHGQRLRESTGTGDLAQAQFNLAHKIEEVRQAKIYGVRPKRIFREAAIKYLREHEHKRSLRDDAYHLKTLDKFIGELTLEAIHKGTLASFIEARREL